jgi:hypothetical protein
LELQLSLLPDFAANFTTQIHYLETAFAGTYKKPLPQNSLTFATSPASSNTEHSNFSASDLTAAHNIRLLSKRQPSPFSNSLPQATTLPASPNQTSQRRNRIDMSTAGTATLAAIELVAFVFVLALLFTEVGHNGFAP